MREIFNKYIFLITFLFFGVFSEAQGIPPPEGLNCCVDLEPEEGQLPSPEYERCMAMEAADEGSYCRGVLPIDNSIYVLVAGVGGVVLASFVIFKIRHKKTPM